MNNILVTGADGQLGNSLRKLSGEYPCYNFIFTDYQDLDITSEDNIADYFSRHEVNYVINCAAYTAVDRAESDEMKAAELNSKAPALLVKAAERYGAILVHISTDYVFNGESTSPITEGEPTMPVGVYGRTKLDGETSVLKYNKGIVIRTSWLYSEYGANFVKTMQRLGAERDELGVVCDQVGTPTYAGDLARMIMIVIERGDSYGLYHFSNEGSCSWYDFATEIMVLSDLKCTVKPITTEMYPTPAKRPKYSILDKSKIKSTFNCEISNWRDSLEKMICGMKK